LWDRISNNSLGVAIVGGAIAALIAAAIAAHAGGVFGGGSSSDASSSNRSHTTNAPSGAANPLRVVFRPVALKDYAVVFARDIGLPRASEQWESLHAQGGIDIGASAFRLTLANRSEAPLTVTNIEAVVRGSRSLVPTGALASVYTQGGASIEEFGAALKSEAIGATAPFHRVENDQTVYDPSGSALFFQDHDIALAPNEVYEAKVEIVAYVANLLEYDFVVTGNTASGSLSYRSPFFTIAGNGPTGARKYRHEYWMLPEPSGPQCWVRVSRAVTYPRCPTPPVIYGAGDKPQHFYPGNRTLASDIHWSVWSAKMAIGTGTMRSCAPGGINCITTRQSIIYTQPRQVCGLTTFTRFRYTKWPAHGELSVTESGNLCIWYTSG
jgi:hypothetical protein